MIVNGMSPIHPGEILREEFLKPLGIAPSALAGALHVPASTVSDIVRERRGITARMAFRLGRYFDTSAQFWMNLQTEYALATAYAGYEAMLELVDDLRLAELMSARQMGGSVVVDIDELIAQATDSCA
ncbi:addiction module antidote protein, HigA family [compost metagenome]